MADDDRRVEPRQVLVGRGLGATPERIAEMQQRAQELEKLSRPKPTRPFGEVLAVGAKARPAPEPTAKERKLQQLPKKGPRPGLAHPAHRDAYGREDVDDETIVLKG